MGGLALTYFLTRVGNIIGAVLFHGPVRDGKGWFQDAMGTRLNWSDLVLGIAALCQVT